MGTEESFCPSEEEIEKWMSSAFDMVIKTFQPNIVNLELFLKISGYNCCFH